MKTTRAETLAHRADWGEVDPRTYPLLGVVHFACEKIGDHERVAQANRLVYAVDQICEQEGEARVRVHLTVPPGGDAKKAIEVRIQPLTQETVSAEADLFARVKNRWSEVLTKGAGRWSAA